MTEGMIAVMSRITELQKRFGLYQSEQQKIQSDTAPDFSQMLQQQQNLASTPVLDDSQLPLAETMPVNSTDKPVSNNAVEMRNALQKSAVISNSSVPSTNASYNSKSVIDLIMQDKRAVSNAVDQYSQNARDLLQQSSDETSDN